MRVHQACYQIYKIIDLRRKEGFTVRQLADAKVKGTGDAIIRTLEMAGPAGILRPEMQHAVYACHSQHMLLWFNKTDEQIMGELNALVPPTRRAPTYESLVKMLRTRLEKFFVACTSSDNKLFDYTMNRMSSVDELSNIQTFDVPTLLESVRVIEMGTKGSGDEIDLVNVCLLAGSIRRFMVDRGSDYTPETIQQALQQARHNAAIASIQNA